MPTDSTSDQIDELPHLEWKSVGSVSIRVCSDTKTEGLEMIKHSHLLLSGSVPCGASTSTQPDHVVIVERNGGASNSRQQDDVVMKMGAEASTSRQCNDEVGEKEEETPRNADQGREKPETKENTLERAKWVESIQKKLQYHTGTEAAKTETIFIPRVPKGSRGFGQGVEKAYEPRVISIGPHHRDKPHLQNMQKRKWEHLKDICDPNRGILFDLNDSFKQLKEQEDRARRSFYAESEQQLNRGDFLEMLLLDGCFIVDYLDRAPWDESKINIWSDHHQIRNDLLLLENQLPFFVVECIYRLVKQTDGNKELIKTAVKFFHNISPKEPNTGVLDNPDKERNFKHLLHLYHAYLFFDERDDWKQTGASQVLAIPSAIFLGKAGVKFKKGKPIDKAMEVRFIAGVMNITPLVIDASTISRFLNLIEFERAHPTMEPRFTAFVQFMDCIINTSEDVALLRKNGILEHAFGSDEEVAGIFNQLTSGTFHHLPWDLNDVYKNADSHCKAKWNHWRATLLRDYFGSPWAAIALLAAFVLLCFDSTQTVFSVLSYVRPRSAS